MSLFRKLRKPRFVLIYPFVPLLFLIASTTEFRFRLGIAVVFLGELIRLWANGYVGHVKVNISSPERQGRKIGRLITGGPYAYVRHPLYFGSFLIGLGVCVVAGRLWIAVLALGLLFIVYRQKIRHEEVLLLNEWGEEYERYRRAIPTYVPTWRRYPSAHGRWSWQGIAASKELKTVVWVFAISVLLYFREELVQEHELFASNKWVKHTALAIVLVVLVASDGLSELTRRLRARARRAPFFG